MNLIAIILHAFTALYRLPSFIILLIIMFFKGMYIGIKNINSGDDCDKELQDAKKDIVSSMLKDNIFMTMADYIVSTIVYYLIYLFFIK